jgi:hypothetical protein
MMRRPAGLFLCAILVAGGASNGLAQMPEDGPFDFTICFTGSSTTIKFDDQHVAFAWVDEKGFSHSNPPGGAFDMMWFRCVGSGGVFEGTRPIDDYCEFADQDGDRMFVVHRNVTDLATKTRESKVDIFAGTGKFAGIKGAGESQRPLLFPDEDPDLYARCVRMNGDYKIP